MNYNQEITLLLIGAGIALVSSLATSLIATLLNHWLANRSRKTAKLEKLAYLFGKISAIENRPTAENETEFAEELVASLHSSINMLKDSLGRIKKDEILLDGLNGFFETIADKDILQELENKFSSEESNEVSNNQ